MALYFDTEFYVPPKDRNKNRKLIVNPAETDHIFLGGVFYQGDLPTTYQPNKAQELWIWNMKNFDIEDPSAAEKSLLEIIYKIFSGEIKQHNNLKTVGIGTTRFDLPALYTRSMIHEIAPKEELYQVFHSGFPIDLSMAGIGYMTFLEYGIEPVPANDLFQQFGIDYQKNRGSSVWQLYEEEQYHLIASRTRQEVESTVLLYNMMDEETR